MLSSCVPAGNTSCYMRARKLLRAAVQVHVTTLSLARAGGDGVGVITTVGAGSDKVEKSCLRFVALETSVPCGPLTSEEAKTTGKESHMAIYYNGC